MGSRSLTEGDRTDIRLLWSQNVRLSRIRKITGFSESTIMKLGRGVERPPCECGRAAGHRGHCRARNAAVLDAMKEARAFWEGAPDEVILRRYKLGDDLDVIADEIEGVTGRRVTKVAVQVRANRLNATRPTDFLSVLRKRGVTGRRKGTKNRRPYVRKGFRARNAKGRFENEIVAAMDECDAVFERFIILDQQEIERCVCYEKRLKHNMIETQLASFATPRVTIAQLNERYRDAEKPLPTARADPATKGVPYRMVAMRGPDPSREARLRQMAEASKGRV